MVESNAAQSSSNKSTNGRAESAVAGPGIAETLARGMTRALVSFGSRVAPYETSGFLVGAFTRTHRAVQRSVDLGDVLVFADRFELDHDGLRVRGYTVHPEGTHPNEVGEGAHVLLVHGWDGGAHQMLPFVRPLVARGHTVSLVDLPAHGTSDGDRTTIREMADVILALGERLGPLEAVIAHSVGSAATTLAMLEGLSLARVVLVAPPLSVEGQARAFADAIGADERALRPMLATIRGTLRRPIDEEAWLRDVETLSAKALVVHDRRDRITSFEGSLRLVAHWPEARLLATEGLGHARVLRDPAVVEAIVSFVAPRSAA